LQPTDNQDESRDDDGLHQVNDDERTISIQEIRDPNRKAPHAYQKDDHHGTTQVQSIHPKKRQAIGDIDDHAE